MPLSSIWGEHLTPEQKVVCLNAETKGAAELLKALCQMDSKLLSIRNNEGFTPAHIAAETGQVELLQLLYGIDPNLLLKAEDFSTNGPAHAAAKTGQLEVLRLLHSLDPELFDYVDYQENSCTHVAAKAGQVEVLQFLYALDAESLTGVNDEGHTPVDVAEKANQFEVLEAIYQINPAFLGDKPALALAREYLLKFKEGHPGISEPDVIRHFESITKERFSEEAYKDAQYELGFFLITLEKKQKISEHFERALNCAMNSDDVVLVQNVMIEITGKLPNFDEEGPSKSSDVIYQLACEHRAQSEKIEALEKRLATQENQIVYSPTFFDASEQPTKKQRVEETATDSMASLMALQMGG